MLSAFVNVKTLEIPEPKLPVIESAILRVGDRFVSSRLPPVPVKSIVVLYLMKR